MAPLLMGRLVAYDMRDGNGVGWFVAVDGRAGGMKIISWNLLRLKGASLEDLAKLIRREQPDLLLMQEVTQDIGGLTTRIGGHFARAPLPGRIHGLAMWSPTPMRHVPTIVKLPAGSVFQRFGQVLDVGDFSVANVHLSHGQLLNRRQLRRLARSLPLQADGDYLGEVDEARYSILPGALTVVFVLWAARAESDADPVNVATDPPNHCHDWRVRVSLTGSKQG